MGVNSQVSVQLSAFQLVSLSPFFKVRKCPIGPPKHTFLSLNFTLINSFLVKRHEADWLIS
jgi:hypothetical protein